jgi:hypothetical protein
MLKGEDEMPEGEEWRTLDSSWMDLEGGRDDKVFNVNVFVEEGKF